MPCSYGTRQCAQRRGTCHKPWMAQHATAETATQVAVHQASAGLHDLACTYSRCAWLLFERGRPNCCFAAQLCFGLNICCSTTQPGSTYCEFTVVKRIRNSNIQHSLTQPDFAAHCCQLMLHANGCMRTMFTNACKPSHTLVLCCVVCIVPGVHPPSSCSLHCLAWRCLEVQHPEHGCHLQ